MLGLFAGLRAFLLFFLDCVKVFVLFVLLDSFDPL